MQQEKNTQLGGAKAFVSMLGICFMVMLTAFDQTVVGTALPRIVADLQGFSYYSWVGSSYLLASAICLPLTGKLGDLYGRKPFVLAAIVSFTLASMLCGMAQNMPQLVLARALQGVGGGMVIGTAFASITDLFPDTARRIRWMSMVTTTFGLSNAVGPMLGGFMTEHFGWRSVFYVNLPVGLIAVWMVWRYLPRFPGHRKPGERIDWLDAALLAVAMSAMLLALEDGRTLGYDSPAFFGLLILGVVAGGWFARRSTHVDAPIIPPRMLAQPAARRLVLLALLSGFVFFTLVFYMPLLLQGGFGRSPRAAGLLLTPLAVGIPLGSIINGRLLPRLSWGHKLMSCGFVVLVVACWFVSRLQANDPDWLILLVLTACGMSFGFQFPNLNLQMQSAVERRDIGAGSALINTTRMAGSMVAASLAAVLVNTFFADAVTRALTGLKLESVRHLLANPQILIRADDQAKFFALLKSTPFDAVAILDTARMGLVSGIHTAALVGVGLAVCGAIIAWKLPPLPLRK